MDRKPHQSLQADIIYKYTSSEGAAAILETGTIRLSSPVVFNDPFDMNVGEPLGAERNQFAKEVQMALLDILRGGMRTEDLKNEKYIGPVRRLIAMIQLATSEQLAKIRREIEVNDVGALLNVDAIQNSRDELVNNFMMAFKQHGIYCTTSKYDSLLMWSHYAAQHAGVVIGFRPSVEKDSAFLASRKVAYSKERPLLYRRGEDMVRRGMLMHPNDAAREAIDQFIFTKSAEWSYEEEYRLAIPKYIVGDETHRTLKFHSEELSELYLGLRMEPQNLEDICASAKRLNPNIAIFKMELNSREYALSPVRVG